MSKWKGLAPPAQGGLKNPMRSGRGGAKSPIGAYKIGRKTRSKKLNEVFG